MFARNFTAAILAAALTTAAAAQDRSDWPKEMTIGTAS
ncbi:MAG: C4-dicarboxylate ABC transporter substrate-binding protein, partial [Alphaproteobacteria bacterium]|nr:C4-dicarboxylate ABC transporter substrate-binding protein [Alphaproteobacteria bacterium]